MDEPAPGQTSASAFGEAIININGGEISSTSSGTKATGWFQVSGSDESVLDCGPSGLCNPKFTPRTWDSGEVTVTVNGVQAGAGYGKASTAAALASSMAAQLNPHPITYSDAGNGTITVTADTPGPNYPLSASSFSNDSADFGSGSFSVAVSGPFLAGGVYPVTTYDSANVTVSIGSFQVSTNYHQNFNTTALALAQDLASRINVGTSPVTATVNQISSTQVQLLLTANAVGAAGNIVVSTSGNTASYQFSVTTSSGAPATAMTGGANPQSTTYSYNLLNDLTQVNQGQQLRQYVYDQLGRLTSASTPESGTVTYGYLNSAGGLCSGNPFAVCFSTDARGVTVTNTYNDPLSRLTNVDYSVGPSGVPATPSIAYSYGTSAAANNNGRLLKMTDGLGSENYSYDIMGRVTQVSRAVTGVALPFNIGYGYNRADQLTSITYPSGRVVQQNYDGLGRLGAIMSGSTTYLSVPASGGYNSAQLPLTLNYGSGVAGAFQYNDHLQMSSLNYSLNGASLLNLSYNYLDAQGHNNGQIQAITDSRGDPYSTLFTYDPLGRLIQGQTKDLTSANTWNLLWNYDIYGNRLSQSAGTPPGTLTTGAPQLTVDPLTNQIQMTGFKYDAAGNLINDPSHSYSYNAEGELTGVDATTTYAYDGHRWRMEKTASGATTLYIYSGSKVVAEYANGAAPTAPSKEYVYSGGSLLATLSGTSVTYHYPDHLSNRLETNATGTGTRTFGHLPFGEIWYESGTPDKWKFTGYERDTAETGLDYAMNRMYSSGFGRFETADLLAGNAGNPQSFNRYSYVSGDPISLIDPSGLSQHPVLYEPVNWGCTLDGIASPCDLVFSIIGGGGGAGIECPNNDCGLQWSTTNGWTSPLRTGPDGEWQMYVPDYYFYFVGKSESGDSIPGYGTGNGPGWVDIVPIYLANLSGQHTFPAPVPSACCDGGAPQKHGPSLITLVKNFIVNPNHPLLGCLLAPNGTAQELAELNKQLAEGRAPVPQDSTEGDGPGAIWMPNVNSSKNGGYATVGSAQGTAGGATLAVGMQTAANTTYCFAQ